MPMHMNSIVKKGEAGLKNKNYRLKEKNLVRTRWFKIVDTNMK